MNKGDVSPHISKKERTLYKNLASSRVINALFNLMNRKNTFRKNPPKISAPPFILDLGVLFSLAISTKILDIIKTLRSVF